MIEVSSACTHTYSIHYVHTFQLDVKGCRDVYQSFLKYVAFETMDGENQYRTDDFGMQVWTYKCGICIERGDRTWRELFGCSQSMSLPPGACPPQPPCLSTSPLLHQDARKGVLFGDLPPVLQLQLKRFEYDFQRDAMVKVGLGDKLHT